MRRRKTTDSKGEDGQPVVGLKELAKRLNLSPTTLSLVLNRSPAASSIPQQTKDRIFDAARHSNYRANFLARSLRVRRSYVIGVLVPELSDGYFSLVLSGIEERLLREGYMYLVTSHGRRPELVEEHSRLLYQRCVEGLIAVDTEIRHPLPLPVVSVSGDGIVPGVSRVVLDHNRAAELALRHLIELGHRHIAVLIGQSFSSDTRIRWESIQRKSIELGVAPPPQLVSQIEGLTLSPEGGYVATRKILDTKVPFTALFAFDDISAIGGIRALRDSRLSVPEDVSVIGFDDVHGARYHIPALTTIRQPLVDMGRMAADRLLASISAPDGVNEDDTLEVEPELIIRESTGAAPCPARR